MDYSNFENEYFKVYDKTKEVKGGRYLYNATCKACNKDVLITSININYNKSCGCEQKKIWTGYESDNIKVLRPDIDKSTKSTKYWIAICKNCEKEFSIKADSIVKFNHCKTCTMLGFENENFKVLEVMGSTGKSVLYRLLCKHCNSEDFILTGSRIKYSKSCGCIQPKYYSINGERVLKHKMTNTRFYSIWVNMKSRTNTKNIKDFTNYVEKGITLCKEWNDFNNFYSDMYEGYLEASKIFGEEKVSIDRIDNDGNYEITNCRWTDAIVQGLNKGKTVFQTPFIAKKGDRVIVSYNKCAFSKLILNHYNKDNSIRAVIIGRSKTWKNWTFEEISEDDYAMYKENGYEYIDSNFNYRLIDYFPFSIDRHRKDISKNSYLKTNTGELI